MTTTALASRLDPASLEQAKDLTPMQMINVAFNAALQQGSAMEVVNTILEQQKWMIEHEEKQLFNDALKRIQKSLKSIPKRGWNPDTQSHFATSEDIDNEIQRLLDAENMTLSFEPATSEKPDEVLIIGTLSLGAYTKRYPLPMPADGKGPKGGGVMSRTHATGSAITYGKRYLKNMIFDLRFKEKDDDGNAAGHGKLGDQEYITLKDNIENARNASELTRFYLAAIKAAGLLGDKDAIAQFEEMANKRKAELK